MAISDGQAPAFLHPNVTHLRHSGVEVGERTAHLLIGMIEHNSDAMMDVRIRTTLVELGSVADRTPRHAEARAHADPYPRQGHDRSPPSCCSRSSRRRPRRSARCSRFPSPGSTIRPPTRAIRRGSSATRRATRSRSISTRARSASSICSRTRRTRASASPRATAPAGPPRCGGPATERASGVRDACACSSTALVADAPSIAIGWFLLGSMRVERDLQYAGRQRAAFAEAPFAIPEVDACSPHSARSRVASARGISPCSTRARSTSCARARDRRSPLRDDGDVRVGRVAQPALDGADTLVLELRVDPRAWRAWRPPATRCCLRARDGRRVPFTVRLLTSGGTLTPLARDQIFTPAFLAYVAAARADGARAGAPRVGRHAGAPARATGARVRAARVAREAHGGTADVRDLLRARHAHDVAHDAARLAARDVGVRDRERAAQALPRGPREPRGGARRPGGARGGRGVRGARRARSRRFLGWGARQRARRGAHGAAQPAPRARELSHDRRRVPAADPRSRMARAILPCPWRASVRSCWTRRRGRPGSSACCASSRWSPS